MQPLLLSMAFGQASLVTPTSVFASPPALSPPPPRQPASDPESTSTAAAVTVTSLFIGHSLRDLVGERPGFPVVPRADPHPEQAARFKDQKNDDEYAVEHRLEL